MQNNTKKLEGDFDSIRLLKTSEAAEILNLSESTLASDVTRQHLRIPSVKIGGKSRRYRLEDLLQYIEDNLQR